VRRMLLVLAVMLVMAAVAAPSALARQPLQTYCYEFEGGLQVCGTFQDGRFTPFFTKEECEQARATEEFPTRKCHKEKLFNLSV
jgi:hypothetical protein